MYTHRIIIEETVAVSPLTGEQTLHWNCLRKPRRPSYYAPPVDEVGMHRCPITLRSPLENIATVADGHYRIPVAR